MPTAEILSHIAPHIQAMTPYRPGKPLEEMKEELGLARVIKLASNENPLGVSPRAKEAMAAAVAEGFRYPDPVSRKLRRLIATRLGVSPDELIVASGSENLLSITLRTLMKPGEKALVPEGAFMGFAIHLTSFGGQVVSVPSPGYRFDVAGLIAALAPDIRIVYLPNPNNPTGSYITADEFNQLRQALPPDTLLLLDEAYIEYCGHLPDYPDALAARQDNILILRTFSKAYGLGGLRVGYGIGHPELVTQMGKVKMTFEPCGLAQVAAEAAWTDEAFLEAGMQNNTQEKARLYQAFADMGLNALPSAGNFIMVVFDSAAQVDRLNEGLLSQGIAIRPLAAFGFPHALRVSIGLPEENTAFLEALATVLNR